jgi:hypothetical protein
MTFELDLSRRSLFAGLGALIAAPAIVRAASLMPVRAIVPVRLTLNDEEIIREAIQRNTYLTINATRESTKMFRNSNSFIANIDRANIDRYWTERVTPKRKK